MTSRLIRCINGDIFDADVHQSCPVCGWVPPGPWASSLGRAKTDPKPDENDDDFWSKRRLLIGSSALGLSAVLGGGVYAVLRRGDEVGPAPTRPSPPVDTVQRTPAPAPPEPDPTQPTQPPRFADLQPLEQGPQLAAAKTLGLTPLASESALMTRALRLSVAKRDDLTPKRWLVQFVRANQPLALADAADACYSGFGVQKDDRVAFDLMSRAAGAGVIRARSGLAGMLLAGRGAPRDPKVAGDWLALAARADGAGADQALTLLGALNRSLEGAGPKAADLASAVGARNWDLVVQLARTLADVQIAAGYSALGDRHWQGTGLPKDSAAALDWWRKGVTIGYPNASYNLAVAANNPQAGAPNIGESIVWLQIARLQSEDRPRIVYLTDKISELSGLLDRSQWSAIRSLFSGLEIPGPKPI